VTGIRIYVEGGGDRAHGKRDLRSGFGEFLKLLRQQARDKKLRWDVIACGGRDSAFDDFKMALRSHPDSFNVLLVDSESPVTQTPWCHLHIRDGWDRPSTVDDDHCHLMIQITEAWFLADVDALVRFYGSGFEPNRLPRNPDIEAVPKADVLDGLTRASEDTVKGRYHKIRHGTKLLKLIDVDKVRKKAESCDRLFTVLGARISTRA